MNLLMELLDISILYKVIHTRKGILSIDNDKNITFGCSWPTMLSATAIFGKVTVFPALGYIMAMYHSTFFLVYTTVVAQGAQDKLCNMPWMLVGTSNYAPL